MSYHSTMVAKEDGDQPHINGLGRQLRDLYLSQQKQQISLDELLATDDENLPSDTDDGYADDPYILCQDDAEQGEAVGRHFLKSSREIIREPTKPTNNVQFYSPLNPKSIPLLKKDILNPQPSKTTIRTVESPLNQSNSSSEPIGASSTYTQNLETLPDELKIYVMTFVTIPTIQSCIQLNKRWNELANRSILWQTLCFRDFGTCSLTESISTWKELYQEYSIPLEQDSRFHSCCYGFLGEHNAVQKLKGREPGTFLFRSSSTDTNAITISFVNSTHQVRHRRMHKIYGGYTFNLLSYQRENAINNPKGFYKTYHQLLRYNTSWLRTPLITEPDVAVKTNYSEKGRIDISCPDNRGPPSSAEINYIAATLRENKTIAKELRIRANTYFGYKISNADMVSLIEALEENTTVTTLSLYHMHLNLVLCSAFAKLVSSSSTLTKIFFYHCSSDIKAVLPLLQKLPESKGLQQLVLNVKTFEGEAMTTVTEKDFVDFQCFPWECSKWN